MKFKFERIILHPYSIPLKYPFRISAGEISVKYGLIVEAVADNGLTGWGEASVDKVPFYAHETVGSAMDVITHALFPLLKDQYFSHPDEVIARLDNSRGNNFAKAAIDSCAWDIYGQMCSAPCWKLLGGVREKVEVGPSLGLKNEPAMLIDAAAEQLANGMRRIKIKIKPGKDLEYISAVREHFPDCQLMVDANNAYQLSDAPAIANWDKFNLLMIEQPLDERDIYFHSILRKQVKNPICLDESIHTLLDAQCCADMGSADIINIKVCRVGGLSHARRIHDFCKEKKIANWIGSRVGSGVAEAARLAAATLENCSLASDCVITVMYMTDDVLAEPYSIKGALVDAPLKPGLGIVVDREKLTKYAPESLVLK